jgi:hypothetical protein
VESFWRVKEDALRWRFAIILLTFSLAACSRSPFDQQHRRAVDENPDGVELEIRTRGEKKQFSVSEPVVFEEFYTSKHRVLPVSLRRFSPSHSILQFSIDRQRPAFRFAELRCQHEVLKVSRAQASLELVHDSLYLSRGFMGT